MNRLLQMTLAAAIPLLIQPAFAQEPAATTKDAAPAQSAPSPQDVDKQFAKMQGSGHDAGADGQDSSGQGSAGASTTTAAALEDHAEHHVTDARRMERNDGSRGRNDGSRGRTHDGRSNDELGGLSQPHARTAQATSIHDGPVDADAADDDGPDDAAPVLDDAASAS